MNVYRKAFSLGMQKALQYRANFYLGFLSYIFPLLIQYFLWTSVFQSSGKNIVLGYTLPEILSYTVFAVISSKIISSSFVFELNEEIKQGGLAKYIVRPIRYLPYRASCFLGEKIIAIFFSMGVIVSVSLIINIAAPKTVRVENIILYVLSIMVGIILNFLLYYCISGVGFWTRDAGGAIFIVTFIGNLLSGGVFPLDIFSAKIQRILYLLPFAYTNFFPVSILCGRVNYDMFVPGLAIQLLWIMIIYLLVKLIWSKGLKKYISVGG